MLVTNGKVKKLQICHSDLSLSPNEWLSKFLCTFSGLANQGLTIETCTCPIGWNLQQCWLFTFRHCLPSQNQGTCQYLYILKVLEGKPRSIGSIFIFMSFYQVHTSSPSIESKEFTNLYVPSFQQHLMLSRYYCHHCQRIDFVELPTSHHGHEYRISTIRCCWIKAIEL